MYMYMHAPDVTRYVLRFEHGSPLSIKTGNDIFNLPTEPKAIA